MVTAVLKKEINKLCKGCAVLDTVLILLCLPFGLFTTPMLLGILTGTLLCLLNFVFLFFTVRKAVIKNPGGASGIMTVSYFLRFLLLFGLLAVILKYNLMHPLGLILPLFFPKLIYVFLAVTERRKGREWN